MDKYIAQQKISKEWNIPIITLKYWRKNGATINGVKFKLRSKRAGISVFINSEDFYDLPTWFRKSYKDRKFKNI